jgi:hypothetical protein
MCQTSNVQYRTALVLQERSLHEHDARDTGSAQTLEVAKLQAQLKKIEDCLGQTILDALELRHNALRTQVCDHCVLSHIHVVVLYRNVLAIC